MPSRDPEYSLPQLLAARARHASDGRLVVDAIGGLTVAAAAAWWHGPAWHLLVSAALCFVAFGAWGIADRELGERVHLGTRSAVVLLRAIRIAAALLGTLAAVALVAAAMAVALGRMIS